VQRLRQSCRPTSDLGKPRLYAIEQATMLQVPRVAAEDPEQTQYHELSQYTLSHPDPAFIHQYVVDAIAAQRADAHTKPVTLTFALIGLYLQIERNYTGKNIQRVHMLLARHRKQWPTFPLPEHRGEIRVSDVLAAPPGPARDAMINTWSASVWQAYRASHSDVVALVHAELS
jgi:hypothetical protein